MYSVLSSHYILVRAPTDDQYTELNLRVCVWSGIKLRSMCAGCRVENEWVNSGLWIANVEAMEGPLPIRVSFVSVLASVYTDCTRYIATCFHVFTSMILLWMQFVTKLRVDCALVGHTTCRVELIFIIFDLAECKCRLVLNANICKHLQKTELPLATTVIIVSQFPRNHAGKWWDSRVRLQSNRRNKRRPNIEIGYSTPTKMTVTIFYGIVKSSLSQAVTYM